MSEATLSGIGSFYRDECCPDCRQMTAGDCGKHGYQLPYYPDALKGQPGVIVVEERQHWTREELKALIREVLAEDMRRAMQMGTIQVEP